MTANHYNPDCGYAWMVVAACFMINFIMAGLTRAAGVLYVALIDDYGVSREVATTPFSMRFCVRNLSGPFVGALGQRFGVRPVVVMGGLICGLGGILSALAPDVTWITAAWGGIHGLGYGMSNIIHTIVINRYFNKYKALAIGISLTGDCFGTFILPLLLEFLSSIYDLPGIFLILAGISLNVVPVALLLRSPPWEVETNTKSGVIKQEMPCIDNSEKNTKQGVQNEAFDNASEKIDSKLPDNMICIVPAITINGYDSNKRGLTNELNIDPNFKKVRDPEKAYMQYMDLYFNEQNKKFYNGSLIKDDVYSLKESMSLRVTDKVLKKKRFRSHFSLFNTHKKDRATSVASVISCPSNIGKLALDLQFQINSNEAKDIISNVHSNPPTSAPFHSSQRRRSCSQHIRDMNIANNLFSIANNSNPCKEILENQPIIPVISLEEEKFCDIKLHEEYATTEAKTTHKPNPVVKFLKTNAKPMLLIISASMAFYVFLFISVFTIIIDYAVDNNISKEYGKYLIIAFSITDIFGRIGFGIVLDRKWFALSHFAGMSTGLMGLFVFIFPFYKCFIFWMISFSLCGFIQGGCAIMFPLLVEKYVDEDEQSVALGSLNFYGGLLMLPVPSMIGFFRDNMGSYDGVFCTVGALCIFVACLWLLEPCFVRKKQDESGEANTEKCNDI